MALGKQIRHYRNKAEWKLKKLSEASDVDVGTISALEIRDSARSEFFAPIAKAFGLTVEQMADESISYDISAAINKGSKNKFEVNPDTAALSVAQLMEPKKSEISAIKYDIWTTEAIKIMLSLEDQEKRGAVANLKTYVHNLSPPSEQTQPANSRRTGTNA